MASNGQTLSMSQVRSTADSERRPGAPGPGTLPPDTSQLPPPRPLAQTQGTSSDASAEFGPTVSSSGDGAPLLSGAGQANGTQGAASVAGINHRNDEWQSWTLSWLSNILVLLVEIGFIATILTLDRISASNNGIVSIPVRKSSNILESYVQKYYGLLWTSLPSFIFSLFGLAWAGIVGSSADRQPFVDLQRGAGARQTIMLDYRSINSLYSWCVAIRRKHTHIALGLFLVLLVSTVLTALSAHLLVEQAAQESTSAPLSFTSVFNTSAITSTTNLQPFIDIATAVQAYGSKPPPWTTTEYAFERFAMPDGFSPGNLTANTTAYSAVLECKTIPSWQYKAQLAGGSPAPLTVSFNDRGCDVQQIFDVQALTPIYAKAWFTFCHGAPYNRFGMLAGQYSASATNNISDFSVTSCIPTYWQTNGSLTQTVGTESHPTFISFTGDSETQMFPALDVVFENALRDYIIFNPASATNADAVGFSIYSAAVQQYSQTFPTAPSILRSTQNVYATIYAALANNVLLQRADSSRSGFGTLTRTTNRLFVAHTVAYITVAALFIVLICHMILFVYAKRHHTMLDEEPVGLLGAAKLLRRSELFALVDKFEERHPGIGEMQEYMKEHYGLGHGEKCWWDENERVVNVVGVEEKP